MGIGSEVKFDSSFSSLEHVYRLDLHVTVPQFRDVKPREYVFVEYFVKSDFIDRAGGATLYIDRYVKDRIGTLLQFSISYWEEGVRVGFLIPEGRVVRVDFVVDYLRRFIPVLEWANTPSAVIDVVDALCDVFESFSDEFDGWFSTNFVEAVFSECFVCGEPKQYIIILPTGDMCKFEISGREGSFEVSLNVRARILLELVPYTLIDTITFKRILDGEYTFHFYYGDAILKLVFRGSLVSGVSACAAYYGGKVEGVREYLRSGRFERDFVSVCNFLQGCLRSVSGFIDTERYVEDLEWLKEKAKWLCEEIMK